MDFSLIVLLLIFERKFLFLFFSFARVGFTKKLGITIQSPSQQHNQLIEKRESSPYFHGGAFTRFIISSVMNCVFTNNQK